MAVPGVTSDPQAAQRGIPPDSFEYTPAGSAATIELIPAGDLLIVLGSLQDPAHEDWLKVMLELFPGDSISAVSELPDEIHVRVSKPVMTAVSHGFNIMLNSTGLIRTFNGCRIYSEGMDMTNPGEALLMLLLTIFGKSKHVPRNIPVLMLSNVCVLIQKYMLGDAVELMTDIWVKNLKHDWGRETDMANMEAGLEIAYVLRNTFLMDAALKAFFSRGTCPLTMEELPFSETLQKAINTSYTILEQKLHKLFKTIIQEYSPHQLHQQYDGAATTYNLLVALFDSHNSFSISFTSVEASSQDKHLCSIEKAFYELRNSLTRKAYSERCRGKIWQGVERIEALMSMQRAEILAMWKDRRKK